MNVSGNIHTRNMDTRRQTRKRRRSKKKVTPIDGRQLSRLHTARHNFSAGGSSSNAIYDDAVPSVPLAGTANITIAAERKNTNKSWLETRNFDGRRRNDGGLYGQPATYTHSSRTWLKLGESTVLSVEKEMTFMYTKVLLSKSACFAISRFFQQS